MTSRTAERLPSGPATRAAVMSALWLGVVACGDIEVASPVQCTLGEIRCDLERLQTCQADGWKTVVDCAATGTTCSVAQQTCIGGADATGDTAPADTTTPDTSTPDTSTPDTSTPDTSTPDTSTPDTSTPDTTPADTSTPDTTPADTSTPDTVPADTASPDTATPDTTPADTAPPDTGPVPGCTDPGATNYDAAATTDDGSCTYAVSFAVDMACQGDVPFTTVHVSGPFCGWCDSGLDLADPDQDGTWTGTFAFPTGPIEFKYMVDAWAGQEDLVDDMVAGGDCAPVTDLATYANRLLEVTTSGGSTSDLYGACDACPTTGCMDADAANYVPTAVTDDGSCTYPVTFHVDMACSGLASFDTVFVTGPFCLWCAGGYALADPDGDAVWSGTFDLPNGTQEYKYMVDAYDHQEDLVDDMVAGASCAPATDLVDFANRQLEITGPGLSLQDTYGSCSPCE